MGRYNLPVTERYSPIRVPSASEIAVSHVHNLGVADYDSSELYSPGTDLWKSKVLDLGSPKYSPNKSYWFDKSRYCNDGGIIGAAWKQLPSGVWVMGFEGDDYISIPHAASLNLTELTIVGWIKNTNLTSLHSIIAKAGAEAGDKVAFRLLIVNTTGILNFGFRDAGGTFRSANSTGAIATSAWYFIASTFTNGGAVNFYFNGIPDSGNPQALAFNMVNNTRPVSIGVQDDNGVLSYYYVGGIGDILLCNRVLTASTIRRYYLATAWRYR